LLRVLADMPGGGGTKQEVLQRFRERYGDYIPPAEFEEVLSGQRVIKWENKVSWCRQDLATLGFVDRSIRNVWRITQAGRDWLAQDPNATRLDGAAGSAAGSTSSVPPVQRAHPEPPRRRAPAVPPGITLEKLERIRQVLPDDQFKRDWGDIYDHLLAEERAKAITPANDRYLLDRIRPLVRRIQDFLQGRGNETPKSEVICDWIFICYILELHREGAALWQYVNKDEVDASKYERTTKFSAACRTRAA
jgi:hypothetical protein